MHTKVTNVTASFDVNVYKTFLTGYRYYSDIPKSDFIEMKMTQSDLQRDDFKTLTILSIVDNKLVTEEDI
jgi:hypothetical protein